MKFEKGNIYTYDEIKEIFNQAKKEALKKPAGKSEIGKDDVEFQLSLMMSGMVVLHTLEDVMFENDK